MKISASIYSNKGKSVEQLVRELDAHDIDMLHVDCVDDVKVFDDIAAIRKFSKTPVDLHIISSEPEKYFDKIEELGIEYVSFQYENLKNLPALPANTKTQFGLSLSSATPPDKVPFPKEYSFIMLMCTTPGQSGGVFNRDSFQKIIECKYRFPKSRIHVDGGVNDQVAYILRLLGVNVVVSGSYLMNHESLGAGMLSFHKAPNGEQHTYAVSDFAVPVKYVPVLKREEANFKSILQSIEKFGLGFVAIVDENGGLEGIVSNADVRRALLANMNDFNAVPLESLINKKPISILENTSLPGMLKLLNELNFIVLFLPVIDSENRLKGTVLLNNLTRF